MSRRYADEVRRLVSDAAAIDGIVNVPAIARQILIADPTPRTSEIEHLVLSFAELSGFPIVFDLNDRPASSHETLLVEFVTEDGEEIGSGAPATRFHSGNGAGSE